MNYYERHLGDYARDTAHLSMTEHGAYTLLLDRYYSTESPIPSDQAHRLARARTKEERAAVDSVLEEFFVLQDGAWRHGRCEEEIEKAQARIRAAQENGRRGGRPKKAINPKQTETEEKPGGLSLGSDLETQQKTHQTPDTITSVPNGTDAAGVEKPKLTTDEIVFGYGVPLLVNAGSTEKNARSLLASMLKHHGDEATVDALRDCMRAKAIDPTSFLAARLPPKGGPPKAPANKHSAAARAIYGAPSNPEFIDVETVVRQH